MLWLPSRLNSFFVSYESVYSTVEANTVIPNRTVTSAFALADRVRVCFQFDFPPAMSVLSKLSS